MLTNQQIFNRVGKHLLTQNEKSVMDDPDGDDGESCAYRGKNGLKCAVGCLILDREYKPEIEKVMVEDLLNFDFVFKNFDEAHKNLLISLQDVHDSFEPIEWYDRLLILSHYHELDARWIAGYEPNKAQKKAVNSEGAGSSVG